MHAPGTILIAADGTGYRAREPYECINGEMRQPFSVLYTDGSTGVLDGEHIEKDVRTIWAPSGIAYAVEPEQYDDRQEQISSALALVDDLVQDAGDLGDNALMHTLANAYHAIERFRIMPNGERAQCSWPSKRAECEHCQKLNA